MSTVPLTKESIQRLISFYEQRMEELEAQGEMDLWALCDEFVRQLKALVEDKNKR